MPCKKRLAPVTGVSLAAKVATTVTFCGTHGNPRPLLPGAMEEDDQKPVGRSQQPPPTSQPPRTSSPLLHCRDGEGPGSAVEADPTEAHSLRGTFTAGPFEQMSPVAGCLGRGPCGPGVVSGTGALAIHPAEPLQVFTGFSAMLRCAESRSVSGPAEIIPFRGGRSCSNW